MLPVSRHHRSRLDGCSKGGPLVLEMPSAIIEAEFNYPLKMPVLAPRTTAFAWRPPVAAGGASV
jgi:hypothetical protein